MLEINIFLTTLPISFSLNVPLKMPTIISLIRSHVNIMVYYLHTKLIATITGELRNLSNFAGPAKSHFWQVRAAIDRELRRRGIPAIEETREKDSVSLPDGG